jgi:hypothetical protein
VLAYIALLENKLATFYLPLGKILLQFQALLFIKGKVVFEILDERIYRHIGMQLPKYNPNELAHFRKYSAVI